MVENIPGVSSCKLCKGPSGGEVCCVVETTSTIEGQVRYFLEKTDSGGKTMSKSQIDSVLADLRLKIELCQNSEEANIARATLKSYQESVDSA